MFELTLFQIFGPRNDILFCLLVVLQRGISNAICDLVLQLFSEGINISFRLDGAIPFHYLKTIVPVHSSTLRSTGSQFILFQANFIPILFIQVYFALSQFIPSKNVCTCFEQLAILFSRPYSGEDTMMCIHSQREVIYEHYLLMRTVRNLAQCLSF